jgi:IQ domain-containing protein H
MSPNEFDIKLSIALAVPILSGEPEKISMFSTKSGAKRIFQAADVPTPISAYDIYEKSEFHNSLARLVAHNLFVNTWIFKIDDEFNGRGHAAL